MLLLNTWFNFSFCCLLSAIYIFFSTAWAFESVVCLLICQIPGSLLWPYWIKIAWDGPQVILMHTEVCEPDLGTKWFEMQTIEFSFLVFLAWGWRRMNFCQCLRICWALHRACGGRPSRRPWGLNCGPFFLFLAVLASDSLQCLGLLLPFDLQINCLHWADPVRTAW